MSNLAIEVDAFLQNELFMYDHVVVLSKPTNLVNVVYDTELNQSIITDEVSDAINSERFIVVCTVKTNDPNHLYSYVEFDTLDDYVAGKHAVN